MATKLTKPVEREIKVPGVDSPVIIVIGPNGLTAHVKGGRSKVFGNWERVLEGLMTTTDVPSHVYGRPMELLKYKGKK